MAAPASAPVTVEQFVARCKSDAAFCKIRIMAAEALLEKNRKACPPGSLSKDAMAARVQDTISDVLEEDPDTFRGSPYRAVVDQIVGFLWPCQPIS
jgi:hypothetical protein